MPSSTAVLTDTFYVSGKFFPGKFFFALCFFLVFLFGEQGASAGPMATLFYTANTFGAIKPIPL